MKIFNPFYIQPITIYKPCQQHLFIQVPANHELLKRSKEESFKRESDVTWQRKLIKLRLGWNWKPIKTLCRNFEHIFSLSPNDKFIVVVQDIYTQQSLSKIQNINHQAAALSRMDSILIVPCNSSAHWPHLAIKTQEPSHQYYTYCLPSVTHAPFVSFYYT